jgi:polyisoprenoid-binding protein YceI
MAQALWAGEELELPSPGVWKVDPAHSGVTFSTRYMMLSKIRGRFRHFDAVIFIAESPEDSRVEVAIEAASIDTDHEERDEHLRSPDFLQVDLFPWLSFHSTQVSRVGATSLQVRGDLTIRGITRPVALDVEFLGVASDSSGVDRAAFVGGTEIDREDWGIVWNKPLDTGGVLAGKRVEIEIEIQALKAEEADAA